MIETRIINLFFVHKGFNKHAFFPLRRSPFGEGMPLANAA